MDGNGVIDAEEWREGLSTLMGDAALSAEDSDLVFSAISGGSGSVKWPRFYSFFDGKAMTSRQHKLALPFAVNPAQNLSTLSELEQEPHAEDEKQGDAQSATGGGGAVSLGQSLQVEAVKIAIAECLNLEADSMLFSGHTPRHSIGDGSFGGGHGGGGAHGGHSSSVSLSNINYDAETFDAMHSLQHIADCEDMLDLMEHHVFQCPDELTMTKWDNRHSVH